MPVESEINFDEIKNPILRKALKKREKDFIFRYGDHTDHNEKYGDYRDHSDYSDHTDHSEKYSDGPYLDYSDVPTHYD